MSKQYTKQKTKENAAVTFKVMLSNVERQKKQLAFALPRHMNAERLARIAVTEWNQNENIQKCSLMSFLKCLMISAQLGLEPNVLGQCYFVPYGSTVNLIVGYRGMIDIAQRSGKIKSIEARVIHENDYCEVNFGTDSGIIHKYDLKSDRGAPVAYYAVAKLAGGGTQFDIMSWQEIEEIRKEHAKHSKIWEKHFDEMAKKTVIRRIFKYLPVSIEVQKAASLDEAIEYGGQTKIINTDFFDVDEETGEIMETHEAEPKEITNQADSLADKFGG